ncbi:MAG: anthranilate phosphoribosyltransferase [Verrucomicrobiae bacterium]|nr:anthranilate phosphoribosyltransferase [Verrucomicrobiae bacterium]
MKLKFAIETLMRHEELDTITCQESFDEIMREECSPLQTAAFLALLRAKPETAGEITSIIDFFKTKMISVATPHVTLDIVGTGGDGAHTVNISTGSALVAAICGIKIAKHGNRAVSSRAGSADVLETLGVNIQLSPEKVSALIDQCGFGFCHAPHFHPGLLKLKTLRRELNLPTTLNLLGPLLNPAHASHYLLGVLNEPLALVMAKVLQQIGTPRSIVIHGCGLDELSTIGVATILEVTPTEIKSSRLDPREFGFAPSSHQDLRGGDASTNAALLRHSFEGKKGAVSDALILNAAVALNIYGLHASLPEAIEHAREALYGGATLRLLHQLIELSHD